MIPRRRVALLTSLIVLASVLRVSNTINLTRQVETTRIALLTPPVHLQPRSCGESLHRAVARGLAFLPRWDNDSLAEEGRLRLAAQLSPGLDLACAPERVVVNFTFSSHGLGSNMIVLANYIIFASLANLPSLSNVTDGRNITLTMSSTPDLQAGTALAASFLRSFTTFAENDTLRLNFNEACRNWDDCIGPRIFGKSDVWKLSSGWLGASLSSRRYGSMNRTWYDQARAFLWRNLLRVTPTFQKELDENVKRVWGGLEPERPAVTVHIRRDDKVKGEAQYINTSEFVKAIGKEMPIKFKTLVLLSDDETAGAQLRGNWTLDYWPERFVFRFAHPKKSRPDRIRARNRESAEEIVAMQRAGFTWLMTDLRLMLDADLFIGTMSSNLAAVACAMQNNASRCRDMDNPSGQYRWKEKNVKIT
jgi:hypothetical protein